MPAPAGIVGGGGLVRERPRREEKPEFQVWVGVWDLKKGPCFGLYK